MGDEGGWPSACRRHAGIGGTGTRSPSVLLLPCALPSPPPQKHTQADYNASSAYYVRALALNPNASTVWGYLRTSLACAGRQDLRAAAEAQDLLALQKALPLEEG